MQLRKARLCLDCEELHDQRQCPVCASETFAFLTQWMPAPERRKKPRGLSSVNERLAPPEAVGSGVAGAVLFSVVRWSRRALEHFEAAGNVETGELR
jgi:hypothetical protein